MTIEIANKIRNGRAVGTLWVVTRRDENNSGIVARFETREEAVAYIASHTHPEPVISLAEYYAAQDDARHDEERS